MAQAKDVLRQISYIAESTFGTTPSTPAMLLLDRVSFKPKWQADNIKDNTVNAFRQVTFGKNGNQQVTADVEVVLRPDDHDTLLEALTMGTWATNELKVGTVATAVRRSFAIEEGFTDMPQYRIFNGMVIDTGNIKFGTDGLVMATFGMIGKSEGAFAGTSVDSSPTAGAGKEGFFHNGGTFTIGGSSAAGWLTSWEFSLKNNYKPFFTLGSTYAADIPFENAEITGKATGAFDSITEYNKFKAGTTSSILSTVSVGSNSLTFSMPQIRYTDVQITSETNAGVTCEFTFEAQYNAAAGTSLLITRA